MNTGMNTRCYIYYSYVQLQEAPAASLAPLLAAVAAPRCYGWGVALKYWHVPVCMLFFLQGS